MNQAELFAIILRRNQKSLATAVDGVTHAESVLQLPGNSNCMNWIVGHICIYRDGMLVCARQPEQMNTAEVDRYVFGTDPITADSESVDFERLVDLQAQTFNSLIAWLESNEQDLELQPPQDVSIRKGYCGYFDTFTEHFAQMLCHESIHIGELNPLRELVLIDRSH